MKNETKRIKRGLLIVSSFIFSSFIALTPLHAAPRDELEQTEQEIDAARERQKKRSAEQETIARDLSDLQKKLVASGAAAQEIESAIRTEQENLRIIQDQIRIKEDEKEQKNDKLAAMVQAAANLGRMPPGAMVVLPGDERRMKAARAVKILSDSIRREMSDIQLQTEELARLRDKSTGRSEELKKKHQALNNQQKKLEKQIAERQNLREKLGQDQSEEKEKLAELVRKAQNLNMLIQNTGRHSQSLYASRSQSSFSGKRSFYTAKGKLTVPIVGILTQRFGAAKRDETIRGIVLTSSTDGAQVVAPFDGQVVFAGTFLNYGKLMILKHSDDFHTLLAGLDIIDAGNGDFLLEGEPIGAMGDTESGKRLYVEIRHHNQPIDPTPWFKNLPKKR